MENHLVSSFRGKTVNRPTRISIGKRRWWFITHIVVVVSSFCPKNSSGQNPTAYHFCTSIIYYTRYYYYFHYFIIVSAVPIFFARDFKVVRYDKVVCPSRTRRGWNLHASAWHVKFRMDITRTAIIILYYLF